MGLLHKWTYDTQRFLLEHFDTIHNSPSQIYHSALPFCPSSSWLFESYSAELSNDVKVVKGLPAEWGKCSRTVTLDSDPWCLCCWNNTAAAGLASGDIDILNVVTGSCVAVLSGHFDSVFSVTFSSDGASLVSGSGDKTIKLWDIQTGGIVRTFSGHTDDVQSVSISTESTIIASGSADKTTRLWDIQTGECQWVVEDKKWGVNHVTISPIEPHNLMSIMGSKVWEWDINGNQVGKEFGGSHISFSLDGTKLLLHHKGTITVQNSATKAILAEFHKIDRPFRCYCLSPDGKLVAAGAGGTIYVWDTTILDPHPIETFKEHVDLLAIVFSSPSSLISILTDGSVRFWQVTLSVNKAETVEPAPGPSVEVKHLTLQAKDGITVTSDERGVVRIWDISTGLCKETFQIPTPRDFLSIESQLVDGRLISVWGTRDTGVHIWDAKEQRTIVVDKPGSHLTMSGDGSRLFCYIGESIEAWSIQTGEVMSEVRCDGISYPHTLDGCRIWANSRSGPQGWDFNTPGSPPIQLSNVAPSKLHPCGVILWDTTLFRVQDVVTGKVFFQLAKGFRKPIDVQWNGQHLVACFGATDVLILDFNHLLAK